MLLERSVTLCVRFRTKLGCIIVVLSLLFCSNVPFVSSYDIQSLSEDQIEKLIETYQNLNIQLRKTETDTERISIENQLQEIEKQLMDLGVERPDNQKLLELIQNTPNSPISRSHPSDLIATFKNVYDIWGYESTYSGGKYYNLIFATKGKDPYLEKSKTNVLYNKIAAGSEEAGKWVNDLISIYVQKGLGYVPILKYFPYEAFFSYKPSPNSISSTGNATIVTLHTVSVLKFIYKYQNSRWTPASTVNKVSYDLTVTQLIRVNGAAKNVSKDFGTKWEYGDYNNGLKLAASNTSGTPIKSCITNIRVHSKSKNWNFIDISIHAPSYPVDMNW